MVENVASKTLAPLIDALDQASKFDLDFLRESVSELNISNAWIDEKTSGKQEGEDYHRVLLHTGKNYEIVLAIWPCGTKTLIHDHGSAESFGMVRVLRGKIFNHLYDQNPTGLEPSIKGVCVPGDMVSVPLGLVHQMGNAADEGYAASLHIYSPAIVEVSYWDPETRQRCNA